MNHRSRNIFEDLQNHPAYFIEGKTKLQLYQKASLE